MKITEQKMETIHLEPPIDGIDVGDDGSNDADVFR